MRKLVLPFDFIIARSSNRAETALHRDLKAAAAEGAGWQGSLRSSCRYFPPEALHHELDEFLQFDLA
jgi:hypothetical protein